jgi:hypothetical protein
MPFRENEVDASFYNLVHQLAGPTHAAAAVDCRKCKREPFPAVQRIAVRRGRGIPDEREFIEVRCHDLTRQGFSFLLPQQPNFDRLVAALGVAPDVIYAGAEVVRCTDVLVYPPGPGKPAGALSVNLSPTDPNGQTAIPMVLVGCRFTERLCK